MTRDYNLDFGHRTQPAPCPGCGVPNNGVTDVEHTDAFPEPGDAMVCWNCGTVATWDTGQTVRRPTADEMRQFLADPRIRAMISEVNQKNAFGRRRTRPR